MNIESIVTPIDFTDESIKALELAISIADKFDATIKLLHVIDIPSNTLRDEVESVLSGNLGNVGSIPANASESGDAAGFMIAMLNQVKERFAALKAKYPDAKLEEHIKTDAEQQYLYNFVTTEQTDLFVVGTNGEAGTERSKAADIIRMAHAPVITVTEEALPFIPKKILFASDFNDISDSIISILKGYSTAYDAEMHFASINTPGFFSSSKELDTTIKSFAEDNLFKNYHHHVYNAYHVEDGVIDLAKELEAELIIMATHGCSGISRWFIGSAAETVALNAGIPVMTLNDKIK